MRRITTPFLLVILPAIAVCAEDPPYNPGDPFQLETYLQTLLAQPAAGTAAANPGTETPATQAPTTIVIFPSAATSTGALGGRSGADTTCQTTRSGLTFAPNNSCMSVRAFLSISAADEIADMPANYGISWTRQIVSATGTTVGANWADLIDGTIAASLQSVGVLPAASYWWSFSLGAAGTIHAQNCVNGTNGTPGQTGSYGRSDMTNTQWMDNAPVACDASTLTPDPYILCVCY